MPDRPCRTDAVAPGNWTFELPGAQVTHQDNQVPLVLADLDSTGLDVECAALLEASAPGTNGSSPYADSDRGGTDSPLDGDLAIGNDDTVVSRVRRVAAAMLVLNDNDSPAALALDTYFGSGGDGADLTLTILTGDGEADVVIADQTVSSGGNFLRLTLPAAVQTLLDGLATGDLWIARLARPTATATDHAVNASPANWSFNLPEATGTLTGPAATDHAVNASPASWTFELPEATVTHVSQQTTDHAVNASPANWTFELPEATVTHTGTLLTLANIIVPDGHQLVGTGSLLTSLADIVPNAFGVVYITGDTVLAGDDPVDLGDAGLSISRILQTTNHQLRINEDGASDFLALYEPGGTYDARQFHVQVDSDTVISVTDDDIDAATSSADRLRWTLTAQQQTDLQTLGVDSRFLLFITEPLPTSTDHAVDASPASWTFDLPEAAVTHTSGTAANSISFTDSSILVTDTFARFDGGTDPAIPAAWVTEESPVFDAVNVEPGGDLVIDIDPSAGRTSNTVRYAFTFESGGETLTVIHTGDIDDTRFTPDNAGAVGAFYDTLVHGAEGTVTISDDSTIQETPNPAATATDHAVNASPANWTFELPEATVTLTSAQPQDHAVNASPANWTFELPEASVTHTTAQPQDHAVNASPAIWTFSLPQARVTHSGSTPAYNSGLAVSIAGTDTPPLRDTLDLRRSLVDGSELTFYARGDTSGLAHVQRDAAAVVTDVATDALLFSGHVRQGKVTGYSGDDELVDIQVVANGLEQHPYSRVIRFADARAINTAASAEDQLDELVSVLGTDYSAGDVDENVNPLVGIGPGAPVGSLLRRMGDVQRINPDGAIDLIMREGLTSAVTLLPEHVLPSSHYSVNLDSTVRRVIAYGAPVRFIATDMLERITESGVNRAVATITPPEDTGVLSVSRVVARQELTGKFVAGDELDGVWDPDRQRFEWSGTLALATDTATVELHGTWQTEYTVDATDPDALAGDMIVDVPVTSATDIRAAAKRELNHQSQPVELMTLNLVLGAIVPVILEPGDAVTVAIGLQRQLDVHLPAAGTLWLVRGVVLTQSATKQASVQLLLSRRLPDYRDRDYWGDDAVSGSGGRQIVIGGTGGAPQSSQVIPAQTLRVGDPVTIGLSDYFTDPDGDALTYTAVSSDTSRATVSVAGSNLTITPLAVGNISVTVTASDASNSAAQIVSVSLVANRAPVVSQEIPDRTFTTPITVNAANYFTDPDGEDLTITAQSDDTTVATVSVSSGIVTVTRIDEGTANITVTASDGELEVSDTFVATAMFVGDLWLSGTQPNGIYRSEDEGATWGALIGTPSGQFSVQGVAVDARNGDIWIAGLSPGGIYRSQNNGATWGALIDAPAGQALTFGVLPSMRVTAISGLRGSTLTASTALRTTARHGARSSHAPAGQTGVTEIAVDARNGDLWLAGAQYLPASTALRTTARHGARSSRHALRAEPSFRVLPSMRAPCRAISGLRGLNLSASTGLRTTARHGARSSMRPLGRLTLQVSVSRSRDTRTRLLRVTITRTHSRSLLTLRSPPSSRVSDLRSRRASKPSARTSRRPPRSRSPRHRPARHSLTRSAARSGPGSSPLPGREAWRWCRCRNPESRRSLRGSLGSDPGAPDVRALDSLFPCNPPN